MDGKSANESSSAEDREVRIGEALDRLESHLAVDAGFDVAAFLAGQPDDLRQELTELAEMTLSLRIEVSGPSAHSVRMPDSLGHYDLGKEVGRGGMGVVYLARDRKLGRQVALKVLPDFLSRDASLRERFDRESQAVARLQHPHIVPLFGAGEDDGMAYLAMQYIQGETLADRTSGAAPQLEFRRAARIVRDLSRAIAYAHECEILHRDVKSSNVMLDGDDKAWILDFGVCRLRDGNDSTAGEGVVGTLRTMAPEQLDGRAEERSDVWGLGLLLFETLAGVRAFPQELPTELIRAIQTQAPPRLSLHRPGVPKDLDVIARKAYARLASDRYVSAAALARDLDAFLTGAPIAARTPTALYSAKLWVRRHRVIAAAVAASLVAVLLVASVAFRSVQRERDRAQADAYAARIAAANAAIAYGESGRALQLLGRVEPDRAGWEWAYLRARAGQALGMWRPLPGSRDALDVLEVEPSTGRVFVGGLDGWALMRGRTEGVDALGSDVLLRGTATNIQEGAWLVGRNALALGRSPDRLQVLEFDGELDGAVPVPGPAVRVGSLPTALSAHVDGRSRGGAPIVLAGTIAGDTYEWRPESPASAEPIIYPSLEDPIVWCGIAPSPTGVEGAGARYALSRAGAFVGFDPGTRQVTSRVELGENDAVVAALEMDLGAMRALIGDAFGTVREVDLREGSTLKRFASAGARRSDGARLGQDLLTSSSDVEHLTLHHIDEPDASVELSGHSAPVWSVAVDQELGVFYTTDREGVLAAWDPRSTSGVTQLRGHENDVWALGFSGDGRALASGGRDGLVVVWDMELLEPRQVFGPCAGGVTDLVFDEAGGRLLCASRDGFIEVCPLDGAVRRSVDLGVGSIDGLCLDPVGEGAIVASAKGLVRLDGNLCVTQESPALEAGPGLVRWAPGAGTSGLLVNARIDRSARTGAEGSVVYGVDPTTLEVQWQRRLRVTPMPALDVDASGARIVVLDGPGTALVLDASTGALLRSLVIPADSDSRDILLRVAFGPRVESAGSGATSPEPRVVATSAQGSSYLWDAETGRLVLDLDTHVGFATAIVTEGSRMVTAGSDQLVLVHHLGSSMDLHLAREQAKRLTPSPGGAKLPGVSLADKLRRVEAIVDGRVPEGSTHLRELLGAKRLLAGRLRVATRSRVADQEVRAWVERIRSEIARVVDGPQ